MNIEANIDAAKSAKIISELAVDEGAQFVGNSAKWFWKRLLDYVTEKIPEQYRLYRSFHIPITCMSDLEVTAFEDDLMPFGKHKDNFIREVPIDYLIWLSEEPDFRRQLKRYLASDKIQREIKNDNS